MAHLSLAFLFLLISIFCFSGTPVEPKPVSPHRSRPGSYVQASCKKTLYPSLCMQYLSYAANSKTQSLENLAQVALSVSLYRARSARSYVLKAAKELKVRKAKEYEVVKECLDQISSCVDQLGQSIREVRRLVAPRAASSDDVFWHVSNVETWMSAALTDATTCVDQFPGRNMSKLKATIKSKVLNVEQTTSIGLALFHRYAARYYKP